MAVGATRVSAAEAAGDFIEEHCVECHDADAKKGGLDLSALSRDFNDPTAFAEWVKVHDRVRDGEMPPKKKARPPQERATAFLTQLDGSLSAASAAHAAREGRTVLRRLNRVEYENTVHDLLGIEVNLKESLPEDATAFGFDNIGTALRLSPVQMERYLQAADVALDAAIVTRPKPATRTARYQFIDAVPRYYRNGQMFFDETRKAAVWFNSIYSPTIVGRFQAPVPGHYHVRISAFGYQTGGKPSVMEVQAGNFGVAGLGGGSSRIVGFFEVPPEEPKVLDLDVRLEAAGDTILLKPVGTTRKYIPPAAFKDYSGMGLGVQWVEIEGPLNAQWPPESQRRLFGDLDPQNGTLADAEKVLRQFLPRAFRRPIGDEDVRPYFGLVQAELEKGRPFLRAIRAGLEAVLCAPDFLYLRETPGRLDDFALAARLSYFLWSSMPDEELEELARQGTLNQPGVLRQQVERMLQSSKASAFTENFTGQWLGLRLINFTTPDPQLYPEVDEFLLWSMPQETRLFFNELLQHDASVLNFVDSDFSMLNGRLAGLYGIPGVEGPEFRQVSLKPEYHRGGVMTQASILKVTANGTTSSPVLRGAWVLDRILGKPAPPPPANVGAIEPDIRGATTIREQLGKHRQTEACAVCHEKIDPPGFALENYDVIGGWREHYRALKTEARANLVVFGRPVAYGDGPAVDASSSLSDGRSFTDLAQFKQILLADPDQIARALTQKLLIYATGHGLEYHDRAAVEGIVAQSRAGGYGLRSLIHSVVQSQTFQVK